MTFTPLNYEPERGKHMKPLARAFALLIVVVLLAACGTNSPFQPKGTITVTFQPADVAPNTIVWDAQYNQVGKFTGDFTTSAPAGTVRISVTADGYDLLSETIQLEAGANRSLDLRLTESLDAEYSSFSVSRYDTARISIYGFTSNNYSGRVTVRASCKEDGYSSLTTGLLGAVNVVTGASITVSLAHSSGFPYFTSNQVRCAFFVEAPGRREVRVQPR